MVEDKGSKEVKRLQDALEFSDAIIAPVREPLLVLDKELRIITANRSSLPAYALPHFYKTCYLTFILFIDALQLLSSFVSAISSLLSAQTFT